MSNGGKIRLSVSKRARHADTLVTVTQSKCLKSWLIECVKFLVCQVKPDTVQATVITQLISVCQCVYIYKGVFMTHSPYIADALLILEQRT